MPKIAHLAKRESLPIRSVDRPDSGLIPSRPPRDFLRFGNEAQSDVGDLPWISWFSELVNAIVGDETSR